MRGQIWEVLPGDQFRKKTLGKRQIVAKGHL